MEAQVQCTCWSPFRCDETRVQIAATNSRAPVLTSIQFAKNKIKTRSLQL